MTVRVGYIPYLNMVPFHQCFGPEHLHIDGHHFEFFTMSPNRLGMEAEKGEIDAGAMSLVDCSRLSSDFEPVGSYGIGIKRAAQSVLVFSKKPLAEFNGVCAVTDETSTSFRLLQVILEARYGHSGVRYGRIPSLTLFDGESDGLLLIGDEALKAKKEGIRGLPVVTDLGEEWYGWQNLPFVFARWVVRRDIQNKSKEIIERSIQKSLCSMLIGTSDEINYWRQFAYELTPEHDKSIALFTELMEKVCLTA
jgi:chorismate dehydratase